MAKSCLISPTRADLCVNPLREQGVTLIELLICMFISALLIFVVAPDLNKMLTKALLETRVNKLQNSIKEAKLAAVKHSYEVVMCSMHVSKVQCADESQGKTNWGRGWIVFVDKNSNHLLDSNDKLIQQITLEKRFCDVRWNRGLVLSFYQFGVLKGGFAGRFELQCSTWQTQLIINWIGRVRRKNSW